ncbi:MAG TPA: glycosyl hydrolase family 79 C-terminal domain-containing protein [Actinocrinis sp.]|jgi:hypothetical protein|uniref:glycosyl hydrolase family 79 C-terminal domain-containing protein n=1 Tax=Actinocrinis sp. TaxID=1920516 RepID=UPI002DDCDD93|nr:glycosyl hydrolase family 79 C-terminal domain-containing protein [Actinocrinis sp.]HEV3173357.1 glycosyl hydrolase family 79 C-terminal domain-containing protein [Actinocrinis sp.]
MRSSVRARAAVALGVTAATLIGVGTAQATGGQAQPAKHASLSITVHPDQVGNPLHSGFVGFSFGAATVAADNYATTDFAGFLKTLGPTGVIRVGGNSGDATFWTSTGEPAPSWATSGVITPDKLQHLATLVQSVGWKVILAVNLKHPDPARAADEAHYAQQIFGSSLLAIEVGNEPNFYFSDVNAYYAEFETYAAAIKAAVPGIGLTAPDAETNHSSWLGGFAADDAAHPDVYEVTDHTYPTSACGSSTATIPELLGTGSVQYETANAQAALAAAAQLHVPAAMTETNSTVCAGMAGVSDVFAAALWSLDYSLLLAQDGIASENFMSGTTASGACDPYTPLCPTTGDLTPRPLYYGMLATELVGTGNFVALDNSDSANIRAYAVKNGDHLTVVLDDVQDPASNRATKISLNLGSGLRSGSSIALATSSSAGLSATTGITLGGQQVGPHGAFAPPQSTTVHVHHGVATVTVQAGSAVIIQFS